MKNNGGEKSAVFQQPASDAQNRTSNAVNANNSPAGSSGINDVLYSHPMSGRKWAVAFMPVYPEDGSSATTLYDMVSSVVSAIQVSSYDNDAVLDTPYRVEDQHPLQLRHDSDWNQLRSELQNDAAHNFFYFGHAAGDFIGTKYGNHITSADLESFLTNSVTLSGGFFRKSIHIHWDHPYRFVFLDGCNTSKGNLPLAFGIPNTLVTQDNWDNRVHTEPRAYLGWSSTTANALTGELPGDHRDFIVNFFNGWSGNRQNQLRAALDDAAINHANNQQFTHLNTKITVYGCPTLQFYQ